MAKTLKEKIEVMQAAMEGRPIQSKRVVGIPLWEDNRDPNWNWGLADYRVKPEPREFWISDSDQEYVIAGVYHTTRANAEKYKGTGSRVIRVREVIE